MLQNYTLKEQRITFMVAMRNDVRLKEYPLYSHYHCFDQYSGRKLIGKNFDNVIFRCVFNFFLPFIMVVADLYLPVVYSLKKLQKKKVNLTADRYFLNHERNLYNISKRIGLQRDDDIWIKSSLDNYALPSELRTVSFIDLVKFGDIFKSQYQALLLHLKTVFQLGYDKYLLSYNAYDWCLNDFALRRLPLNSELIYSCIYDRQAIMYDHLPHANKIMVQHGGMFMLHKPISESPYFEWQEDEKFYIVKGFYKSSPSVVYCLTREDEVALKRSVIANNPVFYQIGYGFKPAYKSKGKSVFIVGYYTLNADKESCILRQLQGLNIEIILKNHPTIDDSVYNEMRQKYIFTYIEGKSSQFPDVDLVITPESTLAYEYKSIGTKVLFYDDIDINDIRGIVIRELKLTLCDVQQ